MLETLRLVVSCQSRFIPSDVEWDRWLAALDVLGRTTKDFRLLVVTEGGHPTRSQIERLRQHNGELNPPTAIISASSALRFFAAALTFVNPAIRCFSPNDHGKAFDHIKLTLAERERAEQSIDRLVRQLTAYSGSINIRDR